MNKKDKEIIKKNYETIQKIGSNELGENAKRKAVDNFKGAILGGAIGIALGMATRKNLMISGLIGLVIGRLIFVK